MPDERPEVATMRTVGRLGFDVKVSIGVAEFKDWPAERITAFFTGVNAVLVALEEEYGPAAESEADAELAAVEAAIAEAVEAGLIEVVETDDVQ